MLSVLTVLQWGCWLGMRGVCTAEVRIFSVLGEGGCLYYAEGGGDASSICARGGGGH